MRDCISGRRTFALIDLEAIRNNVRMMVAQLSEGTSLCAIVKADAYGHGAAHVSMAALEAGADMLGVAMAEEGAALRRAGITAPILVIGPSNAQQMQLGAAQDLDMCVFTDTQLRELESAAQNIGLTVRAHLKIDSGMGRIGITSQEELLRFLEVLGACQNVELCGMFTHFACADEYCNVTPTTVQHDLFLKLVAVVREHGYQPLIHVSNSAAAQNLPELDHDMVRFGISLYGYSPTEVPRDLPPAGKVFPRRVLDLKPAMQVLAEISHVKEVPAGTPIGYGSSFRAPHAMQIATVQIGYGDGYNRLLSNRGHMLVSTDVGPRRAHIVGRVCMDMTMIDVTGLEGVKAGDLAVAMGTLGDLSFDAADIAGCCGTISYEVLLDYTTRVPRIYEAKHGQTADPQPYQG